MPNWCSNSLSLTGKKEWIDALVKILETDDKEIFSHLRPCIDEDIDLWDSNKWERENWGTKWEADDVVLVSCDDECIKLHFESAWSPPIELYEYLVENGWDVEAYYYEGGNNFCGQFVNGEDSCYELPKKKEFKNGELPSYMPEELIEFISDIYQDDEEDEEEEDEEE